LADEKVPKIERVLFKVGRRKSAENRACSL